MARVMSNILKLALCAVNILNLLAAIVLIVAGALAAKELRKVDVSIPIIIIVSGSVVVFVILTGCLGSIRDSFVCLICFAVGMGLVALLDVIGSLLAALLKSNKIHNMKNYLDKGIDNYKYDNNFKELWDSIQERHECCGIDDYHNWIDKGQVIPESCCFQQSSNHWNESIKEHVFCKNAPDNRKYLYENGCFEPFQNGIEKACNFIMYTGIVMGCLKIISIVLGCLLAFQSRDEI